MLSDKSALTRGRSILRLGNTSFLTMPLSVELEANIDAIFSVPDVREVHPWRETFPTVQYPRCTKICQHPCTDKPRIQLKGEISEPVFGRPESVVSIRTVELIHKATAEQAHGAWITLTFESPIVLRYTGTQYDDLLIMEAIHVELFRPDRADLRFFYVSSSDFPTGIAEGAHVLVYSILRMDDSSGVATITMNRIVHPILYMTCYAEELSFRTPAAITKWAYIMRDSESGNYRGLSLVNGFEEFDIPKELIPKEQRLKCNNTLMNFVVDSIFTAQLFPILMERFTFEEGMWNTRCFNVRSSSVRAGRQVVSVFPLDDRQREALADRLHEFALFNDPDSITAMKDYFLLGCAFRNAIGKDARDRGGSEENERQQPDNDQSPVLRTVLDGDIVADVDIRPLLSAIYDRSQMAYVEPPNSSLVTVGEMELNAAQSRVARAYLASHGPRVMAVLAPPGSGKTAVAAAMAAAATELDGSQLIITVQNCATDTIGAALKNMQDGCYRTKNYGAFGEALRDMRAAARMDKEVMEMPDMPAIDESIDTLMNADSSKELPNDEDAIGDDNAMDEVEAEPAAPGLKLCPQLGAQSVYHMKAKEQLNPEEPKPYDLYDRMGEDNREKWAEGKPGKITLFNDPNKRKKSSGDWSPQSHFDVALRHQTSNVELIFSSGANTIVMGTLDKILSKCETSCAITEKTFRHVRRIIIDEASLLTEVALFALMKRFPKARYVLIGDPMQLPPFMYEVGTLGHELAGRSALDVALRNPSLFRVQLNEVYRAPPSLVAPYNRLAYVSDLRSRKAEESVGVLSSMGLMEQGVPQLLFVNVDTSHDRAEGSQSLFNEGELEELEKVLERVPCSMTKDVMIICLYKEQKRRVSKLFPLFSVYTVDSAQGKENEIVILLTTRTSSPSKFFSDLNRANVAVSRQKRGLIVFGNWELLSTTRNWETIVNKGDFSLTNYYW